MFYYNKLVIDINISGLLMISSGKKNQGRREWWER